MIYQEKNTLFGFANGPSTQNDMNKENRKMEELFLK